MVIYKNILVALDISSESIQIAKKAIHLAELHQVTNLHLISVVEPVVLESSYDLVPVLNTEIENDLMKRAENHIVKLMKLMKYDSYEFNVVVGSTKSEIHRIAEEKNVDLIVIGTHGRHGIARLLGSTASAVLHGAPCDVLVVKITEQ